MERETPNKLEELFLEMGGDQAQHVAAGESEERAVQTHSWTWGELRAGDCVMEAGSRLIIYNDGFGRFIATTYTRRTHSGDTWHHLMYVTDDRNQFLFWAGFFDGPRMNDGNPPPKYAWERQFRFNPALFARASRAFVRSYAC